MEYLKEFKVLLMIGGECYDSNYLTAYNAKEAKEAAKAMFETKKGQTVVVRSLGFAVDPQTGAKIGRSKTITVQPSYLSALRFNP